MKRVRAAVLNCCAGDPENEDSDFEDEVKMTDWKGLPDLALLHIVDLLCPEDVARLAQTCRRFHSLLPRFLVIRGKDFHVRGPTYQQSVTVGAPPEIYFDGPPFTSAVKKLTMSLVWKDQGWGNLKGEIFMKLMRPAATGAEVVAEKRRIFGIAKHHEESASAELSDSPVVRQAQPGDFYRFMRNVGSGGGHELTVRKFRVGGLAEKFISRLAKQVFNFFFFFWPVVISLVS